MIQLTSIIQVDFDCLENHNPICTTHLGTFRPTDKLSSHGAASKWLAEQPPVKMYLGYDEQVYPQYRIKTFWSKN